MTSILAWLRRLRGTFRSNAFEAQMDQELRFHLERDIERQKKKVQPFRLVLNPGNCLRSPVGSRKFNRANERFIAR